jgi:hypothetical protein
MEENKTNAKENQPKPDIGLLKLKILSEFLFPDLKTGKCSYLRFDSIIQILEGEYDFDTLTIFKDIVGEKKKYITYGRLKNAYNLFRDNNKALSVETKNFFSYLYSDILKVMSFN